MQNLSVITWILLGLLALGGANSSAANLLVINEILANNKSVVPNGDQYPDYVELYNGSSGLLNLAGARITDDPALPAKYVFPSGTTIPGGGYLLVWCDTNSTAAGLHSGFGLNADTDSLLLYAADGVTLLDQVTFGLQVPNLPIGRIPNGTGSWQLNQPSPRAVNEVAPTGNPSQLRLNEWMAHPLSGEDWLEVYNGDALPVCLSGLVLTDLPSGVPSNRAIPALSFVGGRGFARLFASDLSQLDADHLDFKLATAGETLTIYAADRATIIDRIKYGTQSLNISQGRAPDGSDNIVFFPAGAATPDEPNFASITSIVISEVLSHTDLPFEDAIELHNITSAPVDISYWWLSDSASVPQKFQIPAGTIVPAGGYRVFYEYQIGAGTAGFTLDSAEGDQVYLSAGNSSGNLTGAQTYVSFGALKNGVSAGLHETSSGLDFVPLATRSFGQDTPSDVVFFRLGTGSPNALARVGPVVINEIHFQPPEGVNAADFEFLEFHNPSSTTVALYDPFYPTNTWRVRDGISYDFPQFTLLPAGGFLLLVNFDPSVESTKLQAFRAAFSIGSATPILGPYSGRLSDSGETLKVYWPDEPQGADKPNAGLVPYELVELIQYRPSSPWPAGADGTGLSLQRRDPFAYGNEPTNWFSASPTPGRAASVDTDGDGMPDEWEEANHLDPGSDADASQDLDQDGMKNLEEYIAGTAPGDPSSVLRIRSVEASASTVRILFDAVSGKRYSIQERQLAAESAWQNTGTGTTAESTGPIQINLPLPLDSGWAFRIIVSGNP